MSSAARKKTPLRRGPGRALLRWHRRIGVTLSVIFLVICATGILLNHNVDLDLDNKRVEADWIYKWYGIEPTGELVHYKAGDDSIAHFSGSLYFNEKAITSAKELRGVASLELFHLAATDKSLIVLSHEGQLIETLTGSSIPGGEINRILVSDTGRAILETNKGTFLTDSELLVWQAIEANRDRTNLTPSPANPKLEEALISSVRGEGISWNRVILDLHSGRFFGSIGKWIADLTAFGLIFLTLTGIWYTTKHLKKARERALSK